MILCTIVILSIITVVCYFIYQYYFSNRSVMSFKASNDLVGLPIITFYSNNHKLHFLLDTGADRSAFSKDALNLVEHVMCQGSNTLTDAGGHVINVENAYLRFYYESKAYESYFQLIDMSPISNAISLIVKGKQVDIVGVIGDDFLTKYKYVLDFQKMIAYSKS